MSIPSRLARYSTLLSRVWDSILLLLLCTRAPARDVVAVLPEMFAAVLPRDARPGGRACATVRMSAAGSQANGTCNPELCPDLWLPSCIFQAAPDVATMHRDDALFHKQLQAEIALGDWSLSDHAAVFLLKEVVRDTPLLAVAVVEEL